MKFGGYLITKKKFLLPRISFSGIIAQMQIIFIFQITRVMLDCKTYSLPFLERTNETKILERACN